MTAAAAQRAQSLSVFFQGQPGSPLSIVVKLMLLGDVVTFRLLRWHCTVDANNLPKHGLNVARNSTKNKPSLQQTAERPLPRRVAGLLCIFELNGNLKNDAQMQVGVNAN